MVIDASAVIAILLGETDAARLAGALASAPKKLMSAFSLFESAVVIEARKGPAGGRELDLLVHKAAIEIVPFNGEQVQVARDAWHRFGKGRHPAGLNICDCCAYALSRHSGEPLLFKGKDFSRTNIDTVSY